MCKHTFYIHSSFAGPFGYFHILTIVNKATVNMQVQLFLWDPNFNYFGYLPRSRSYFQFFEELPYCFLCLPHPTRCCYTISHLCYVRRSWREDVTASSLGRLSILECLVSGGDGWMERKLKVSRWLRHPRFSKSWIFKWQTNFPGLNGIYGWSRNLMVSLWAGFLKLICNWVTWGLLKTTDACVHYHVSNC